LYICQVLTIKTYYMTREFEMEMVILHMEQELRDDMQEMLDAFGPHDSGTNHAATRWAVLDDLLTRLNLTPNEK
jgi:hypothetical protein